MAKVTLNDENLINIANAIRNKNGSETEYKPREMAPAITNMANSLKELIPQATVTGTNQIIADKSLPWKAIDYSIEGNSVQARLPKEYQEVEYIESTGTQYIDTGVVPEPNTILEYDGQYLNTSIGRCGLVSILKNNSRYYCGVASGKWICGWDNNNYDHTISNADINRHKFRLDKNSFKLDNITLRTYTDRNIDYDISIYLFGTNDGGMLNFIANMRIYSAVIFLNENILSRNFIPCYRKSDNVIGLYDTVTKTFYTNQGTGTFLKGNDILPNPDNPIEIKSVGNLVTSGEHQGKYEIPVKIRGKNLFDNINETQIIGGVTFTKESDGSITLNGTSTNGISYKVFKDNTFKKGISYTHSVNQNKKSQIWLSLDNLSKTMIGNYDTNSITFSFNEDTLSRYYLIYINSGVTFENYNIKSQIRETSIGDDTYEPYHEPITVPIYLDKPLRSNKDMTVADEISFATSKRTNKIGDVILDGSENINSYSETPLAGSYQATFENIITKPTTTEIVALSNYFKGAIIDDRATQTNLVYTYSDGKLRIANNIAISLQAFKQWLAQKYANGNPLEVQYELANPTEETISLPELPLHEGTNIIEIDTETAPSQAEVIYYKDWRLENGNNN